MGHNLKALGSASLDAFGGLITFADARDVPRVRALVTGCRLFRRLRIHAPRPAVSVQFCHHSDDHGVLLRVGSIATFTYVGSEPTVNEGFLLNGFTALLLPQWADGVCRIRHHDPVYSLSNRGSVRYYRRTKCHSCVYNGSFVGPNVGSSFNGPAWTNPSGISSATSYASWPLGFQLRRVPRNYWVNQGSGQPWLVVNQCGAQALL